MDLQLQILLQIGCQEFFSVAVNNGKGIKAALLSKADMFAVTQQQTLRRDVFGNGFRHTAGKFRNRHILRTKSVMAVIKKVSGQHVTPTVRKFDDPCQYFGNVINSWCCG